MGEIELNKARNYFSTQSFLPVLPQKTSCSMLLTGYVTLPTASLFFRMAYIT